MKRILAIFAIAASAAFAQTAPQQPDYQAAVVGYRQALTSANDQLADALGKLARANEQIAQLQAKVDELQKQVDAAKPKDAKGGTAKPVPAK